MKNQSKLLISFFGILVSSLILSIALEPKPSLACNSGLSRLDPTCPGRPLGGGRMQSAPYYVPDSQPKEINEQLYEQVPSGTQPVRPRSATSPQCQKTLREINALYPVGSDDNRRLRSYYPDCNFN